MKRGGGGRSYRGAQRGHIILWSPLMLKVGRCEVVMAVTAIQDLSSLTLTTARWAVASPRATKRLCAKWGVVV